MNSFMTFDKDGAQKAGGSDYINETGAYTGVIEAKAITAKSGSLGVEFSIKTDDGLTGNYISIYFQKANGDQIKSGYNHLQSLMGLLKVGSLNQPLESNDFNIPELSGKKAGVVLQKRMYTKNSGDDGFDFQLRAFFNPETLHTYKEQSLGDTAKKVEYLNNNLKDVDERTNGLSDSNHSNQSAPDNYDF